MNSHTPEFGHACIKLYGEFSRMALSCHASDQIRMSGNDSLIRWATEPAPGGAE
jgi:hypothetical protein